MDKTSRKSPERDNFKVILLGIIFNPKTKKVLIGKRENDPYVSKLGWSFPSGRVKNGESVEETLKNKIREKTGFEVASLGSILATTRVPSEKNDLFLVYFLCEVIGGKEKVSQDFTETKWVAPHELIKYFTTSMHPKLKEYLEELE